MENEQNAGQSFWRLIIEGAVDSADKIEVGNAEQNKK